MAMLCSRTGRLCLIMEDLCPRYRLKRKNYIDRHCLWNFNSYVSPFSCAATVYQKSVEKRNSNCPNHIGEYEKKSLRLTYSLNSLLFKPNGNLNNFFLPYDNFLSKNVQSRGKRDFHITYSNNLANKSDSKSSAATVGEYDLFDKESNLSLFAKFKLMYKKYWYVLIPVHVITSLGWIGIFYYLSKSGVNVGELLSHLHISETVIGKMEKSNVGHWAVAYLCYKIATPIRYAVTLGGTTASIKYLIQNGYLKPLSTKQEFIGMSEQKISRQNDTSASISSTTNRTTNCGNHSSKNK